MELWWVKPGLGCVFQVSSLSRLCRPKAYNLDSRVNDQSLQFYKMLCLLSRLK